MRYLAACLDGDGYLRSPLNELSENLGCSPAQAERYLSILRSLEPAGVGAETLSQCLELQLDRIHETGPAREIVRHHLEALARRQYKAIANKLGISVEEVRRAERLIRELEPRPGSPFEQPEQVQYILPDLFVEEGEEGLTVRLRGGDRPPFQISDYYRKLLQNTEDQEVRGLSDG